MKRAPIAFLAALVAGMALVAAGAVGDRFGFHDWPMSPAPQMAQHVVVEHTRLVTPETTKKRDNNKTSPATVAAESADQTLPADSARGATRLVSEHTHSAVRQPTHQHHASTPSTPTTHGTVSDGAGTTVAPAPSTGTPTETSTSTPATPATATTPADDVTAASTPTETPARTEQTPPATPDPTPAPEPPTDGNGNGHHGRHRGPVRQLLHDLLGVGNVQD